MKKLSGIAAVISFLILIVDSKLVFTASLQGIELCLKTVIPSLFPFVILSGIMLSVFRGTSSRMLRGFGKLLGIPEGAESLVIPALLGGYPIGAQCTEKAYEMGILPKESAEKLLFFCSNAGPSFLFGILPSYFDKKSTVLGIWIVQLLSVYVSSCFIRIPDKTYTVTHSYDKNTIMDSAIFAMSRICGWVILGRIAVAFCNKWFLWLLSPAWRVAIAGMIELTNGCSMLRLINNEALRFIVCSGMLSFGGLCVVGQTKAVAEMLNIRYYWMGKAVQMVHSLFFAMLLTVHAEWMVVLYVISVACLSKALQNRGSIPDAVVV